MSPQSSVSVIRIGCAAKGTLDGVVPVDEVLRKALKTHFDNITGDSDDAVDVADQGHLTIANRYFTARVALHPLASKIPVASTSTQADSNQQEDGVLLLFWEDVKTAHSLSLFDELASLHDQAERDDQCGELLRLCVRAYFGDHGPPSSSSSLLSPKQQEEEYARRILWCLDRGYEYIEADLSNDGVKQGHDVRDKDGFARIVEAISGTVWSSAVMKSNVKTNLQTSYQQVTEKLLSSSDEQEGHKTEKESLIHPILSSTTTPATTAKSGSEASSSLIQQPTTILDKETTVNGVGVNEAPWPLTANEIKEADEKARKLLSQQAQSDERASPAQDSKVEIFGSTPPPTLEDEEQDSMLQNFEMALREATRIRELSKSGWLNDDERRQRAGDAANLLMSMLDQMGFDDDDEDDDDEKER